MNVCCYWYVKDTILKAIHNLLPIPLLHNMLLLICQRYNFESNSQRYLVFHKVSPVVTDMSKIQFWKQFTTDAIFICFNFLLLLICQRYNFESNSQHIKCLFVFFQCCYWYVKDTILKAIHNSPSLRSVSSPVVTDMSKIQFWKQFTTFGIFKNVTWKLLLICQRYNFESNSQPVAEVVPAV